MSQEIDYQEKLEEIAWSLFEQGNYDDKHRSRLTEELKEISVQMEHEYFVDLYNKKCHFKTNENNLFIVKLLGLVDDFNIEENAKFVIGEFPDVDTDFLPEVRDYIKNVWAPKEFGPSCVCSIGNYTTFGIKSSLIDMAKVFNKSRNEILDLTTKIGLKDDDGKQLTWEKALEIYPLLKKYCDENPDVADASRRLLNRNRGMGMHAAGLIIANRPIDNLVPMVRGKDGVPSSAFVEGLHGTTLGPLGLIKIDALSLISLKQIAKCTKLIKERHNLTAICAKPGKADWSDVDAFLYDEKALKLANEGKLKCIFQFDSDGIRELTQRGGVESFEDVPAYSAIYRPGPLNTGMDKTYTERKKGRESYSLHPLLKPILGYTYGVMVFQEQIMQILRVVGDIPDMHCEIIRKAISKKKSKVFSKYKDKFIKVGQVKLGWTEQQVKDLWDQVEAFSDYGFNKSHSYAYAYVSMKLLRLKAHYPLEFFSATLNCEDNEDKIKEYKYEIESIGLPLEKLDLNKSKVRFEIFDDKIYIGFSNVKGIGDEVGKKIVAGQPYSSFEDFLQRFGTEAKVLTPLIALRTFPDETPEKLYEYYEYYKDQLKKIVDSDKRYIKSQEEKTSKLLTLLSEYEITHESLMKLLEEFLDFDESKFYEKLGDLAVIPIYKQKEIFDIAKKYKRSYLNKKAKVSNITSLKDYKFTNEVFPDIDFLLTGPVQMAEERYYGYSWVHLITSCPDYKGERTFTDFDNDKNAYVRMCEVQVIEQPKRKKSAKGTVYWLVRVEDANNRMETIQFWDDDYSRFKEELEFWEGDTYKGNFLKIRLKKPEPPWKNYQFDAPLKQFRWRDLPKDKKDDARIIVMARLPKPAKPEKSAVTDVDKFVENLNKNIIVIGD